MQSKDERIRLRAHEIWEQEGRQEGRAEAHWAQAQRELQAAAPGEPGTVGMADGNAADTMPMAADRASPASDGHASVKAGKKPNGASKAAAAKAPAQRKRRGSQGTLQA